MENKTRKRTARENVIKNDLTGKEAVIRRENGKTIITPKPESEAPKIEPEPKAKANPKAEKKAEAEPKAEKEKSPLRRITLSRSTVQITVPSEERDKALESLGIKLGDLKAKRSLTVWDGKQNALVTRIVEAKGG